MSAQDPGAHNHDAQSRGNISLQDPPPLKVTVGNTIFTSVGASISLDAAFGGIHLKRSTTVAEEKLRRPCVRSTIIETKTVELGVAAAVNIAAGHATTFYSPTEGSTPTIKTIRANDKFRDQNFVVIGIWNPGQSMPREVILPVGEDQLFKQIRSAKQKLRPWGRRILSLKKVVGFSVYQCVPSSGHHLMLPVDKHTQQILTDLFREYNSVSIDQDDRWLRWIMDEMNCKSKDPEKGKYALRLVLGWSPAKIVFWTISPVILSLVIAFWYSYKPRGPDTDEVAIVQTAWTIASYIITAAALMIAGLGAVTQLGN
ncbi:hypothetical protein QBC44DRAFT_401440 [Cladorrhinum sp. PSN332]|nr:hypothetical protein QBC44DRAFT_401440 [Cladorrhinum sp. PSN332]